MTAVPDHFTWRHWVLAGVIGLAVLGMIGRLVRVQIQDHELYLEQAAVTRWGAVDVPAPRGVVLDATGYPLATSIDTWDVYLDSFLWRDRSRATVAAFDLGTLLEMDASAILERGTAQSQGDVVLRRQIDYDLGTEIQRRGLWGVRLIPSSVRLYPEGNLAGQIVGYVGLDGAGLWGIEADFDPLLRGQAGRITAERDALGRPIAFAPRTEQAPAPGGEIQLTIDRFMQEIVERHLDEAVQQHAASGGTILVMDPHTGAILAMASRPSVRLSELSLDDPELADLVRNRAISDLYEPGSVFKTLTTATAIDLGLISPGTVYEDKGVVQIGGYGITNWDYSANGIVTMTEYLQKSLNTGSVWIAEQIGPNDFYRYLREFGIGEPTHLGLSGEAEGMVRSPEHPDWYPVDLATNSYGQGLATTPLQMLTAVNTFANGGKLMRPYVVSRTVSARGVRSFEPVEIRRPITQATADTMARMMRDVVEGVERHGARVEGYEVAGKTGTTLVSIPTGYDLDTTIASFAGFLPYDAPRISVLVKIDEPRGGRGLGGEVAAPVFSRVATELMEYLDASPSVRASAGASGG